MLNNSITMYEVALEQHRDRLKEAEYRRLYHQARKNRAIQIQKIAARLWLNIRDWFAHAQTKPITPAMSKR